MPRTKSFDQEQILDKATNLFWQQGYNGTPPQDILDTTGLSRSSLYDTFGDKHSLFLQCLQRYRDTETEFIINYLDGSENTAAAIRNIFHGAWAHTAKQRRQKGCLMVNSLNELGPHDPEVASIVQENRKAIEDAFHRAIRRGQQQSLISTSHQPRAFARYLINCLWGLTVQIKLGIDKRTADDIAKITLSVL
jgi:TetR/AcrR family transcriptional repressor of nem operon